MQVTGPFLCARGGGSDPASAIHLLGEGSSPLCERDASRCPCGSLVRGERGQESVASRLTQAFRKRKMTAVESWGMSPQRKVPFRVNALLAGLRVVEVRVQRIMMGGSLTHVSGFGLT